MQKFVGVYVAVAAAAISLASYSAAQASPVPLPLPSFTDHGNAWLLNVVNGIGTVTNDYLPDPGPFPGGFAFQTLSGSSSTARIDAVNSARLTASETTSLNGPQAGANVDLEYYFRVSAPVGYSGLASVTVAGSYFVSQGIPQENADLYICATDCSINRPVAYFQADGTGSTAGVITDYELDFDVTLGIVYQIEMVAQVYPDGSGQSNTAWIDPIVSVDPEFQLELSHGISNVQSATPLPAALPLFASGLGAMGLLGWRRSPKAQRA